MHWGLPWSCSELVSLTGAGSGNSSRSCSMGSIAMHEVQRAACCMIMSNLTTLTSMSYLLKLPLAVLVFSNLTMA
jgi:hypothetical protein